MGVEGRGEVERGEAERGLFRALTLLNVRGVDGVEEGATEDGVTDDLDDGAEEEEDKPTDGEFPGVGGSDGNGSDDDEEATNDEFPSVGGSDGNGSDDGSCSDVEGPRENLSSMTLSVSTLITKNSWNQPLTRSLLIFFLFFFLFCQHIFVYGF